MITTAHATTDLRTWAMYALLLLGWAHSQALSATESKHSPAPAPQLTPDPTVIQIAFPSVEGSGNITVTGLPADVTTLSLRAQPLTSGANKAFVQFPTNADTDSVELHCEANHSCSAPIKIVGVRAEGTYQGAVEAYVSGAKIASATLAALRSETQFQPILSGDLLKNGRIEFDATSTDYFTVTLENPSGSPWRTFVLRDCSDDPAVACQPPAAQPDAKFSGLLYSPSRFVLGPGRTQTVLAHAYALGDRPHPRFLQVADGDLPTLETTTLVVVKKLTSQKYRSSMLLLAVVAGAIISVILNNVFPTSRARSDVEGLLRRVQAMLAACSDSIGPALRDAVSAEISRNRLILRGIRFYHVTKESALLDVQLSANTLLSVASCAKSVSSLRGQIDSDGLPVRVKLSVECTLKEAEEALIGLDSAAGATKVADATRTLAVSGQSGSLAGDLAKDIRKLVSERGNCAADSSPPPLGDQPRTPTEIAQSRQVALTWRAPYIARRVEQLELDLQSLTSMPFTELLEVERDFYVADVWTELVEPALREDRLRFGDMAAGLLVCLQRNPVSEHVQLSLAMVHSLLTPQDLSAALQSKHGFIDSNEHPRYLDTIDCRFIFIDRCIQSVTAARRFVTYRWDFDDGSEPPESYERCRHYFAPPRFFWLRNILGGKFRSWGLARGRVIKVHVGMPGAPGPGTLFEHHLKLRDQYKGASELGMLQFISFFLSTAIAVLAAYAAQYGAALPDTITWQTAVTAFMFGFGIDQIRDKATTAGSAARAASVGTPAPPVAAVATLPQGSASARSP